ncbi:hypothetical protein M2447_001620 [Ereboglobus sp. PH5-10]|nr:hypothetical protein [Ereboglobus sp. PH5-10]
MRSAIKGRCCSNLSALPFFRVFAIKIEVQENEVQYFNFILP